MCKALCKSVDFSQQEHTAFFIPLHITIIGHEGKMGAMLAQRFEQAGHYVAGVEAEKQRDGSFLFAQGDLQHAFGKSEIVILCVPVTALNEVLEQITCFLDSAHVLVDITSVKTRPLEMMQAYFKGAVIGTHPLFGPTPKGEDMRVALVQGHHCTKQQCQQVELLFRNIGCTCFWATAQEHDKGVGIAQSLNFAVSAAFFATVARFGDERFLTPSFKRHLEAARKHLTEDTAMFCEFTSMNPYFVDILHMYTRVLDEAGNDPLRARSGLEGIAHEAAVWYENF